MEIWQRDCYHGARCYYLPILPSRERERERKQQQQQQQKEEEEEEEEEGI